MASLGHQVINGVSCEIAVSSDGMFTVSRDGETISHAFLLQQAVTTASSKISQTKVRVQVDFFTLNGKQGTATGIHASNGKVLARIGGKSEQFDMYTSVLKGETPQPVVSRLIDINNEVELLKRAENSIKREWGMKLGSAVKKAIEEATSE
jgi:hypothetical protein